jgi:peroxiredoxin
MQPQAARLAPSEVVMDGPQVGDPAPDFTLPRTLEESVTLSELFERGPVLLHFYVFDFGSI